MSADDSTTEARLRKVFIEALDLHPGTQVEQTHYQSTPTWDSLGHVLLVSSIENEFGIELDTNKALEMESYTVALTMVNDHLAPS